MTRRAVCMIAYANYYTDARIKNYVDALLRQGYAVDVFALGKKSVDEQALQPGLRVFAVMEKYWGDSALHYALVQVWFALRVALAVAWQDLTRGYCLIHVHNMPDFLVFSAMVPRLLGTPVILDVHDTTPEVYATKFDVSLGHPLIVLLRWQERLSAAFATQVITSNALQEEVLCSHGLDARKIEVILNVGNERLFKPVSTRPMTDELLLVYHGTIAERLGLDVILQAIHIASQDCPKLKFLLIGDGDFLPTVKTLVSSWGLTDRVQMLGFVPVEELATYLAAADVGVVGTKSLNEAKHNYCLPVKMLEYAAMEIPTIAPDLQVIRRYFDDDSAIFYTADDPVDMARRLRDVYVHREMLPVVRQHLQSFNRSYNWSTMERIYLDIVARLTHSPRPVQAQS